jgi:hypothetical protein
MSESVKTIKTVKTFRFFKSLHTWHTSAFSIILLRGSKIWSIWIRIWTDLIFSASQTDSNLTRPGPDSIRTRMTWKPKMIRDHNIWNLTLSEPERPKIRDDPRSNDPKPEPNPRWPELLRTRNPIRPDPKWLGTRKNPIIFDPKPDPIRIRLTRTRPVSRQFFSQTYPIRTGRSRTRPAHSCVIN